MLLFSNIIYSQKYRFELNELFDKFYDIISNFIFEQ